MCSLPVFMIYCLLGLAVWNTTNNPKEVETMNDHVSRATYLPEIVTQVSVIREN